MKIFMINKIIKNKMEQEDKKRYNLYRLIKNFAY